MSELHLKEIKNKLESSNWIIKEKITGDDYKISETWIISRPNGDNELHLEFDGLDELHILSIHKSYGCKIKENPTINLYFSKISKSWDTCLDEFINSLNSFY